MKKRMLILVLLALVLSACSNNATLLPTTQPVSAAVDQSTEDLSGSVTAEGMLLPSPYAELSFAQGGVIAEVQVKPGDRVTAGAVIARLVGLETAQAELAAAKLEQTLAQRALADLHRNALVTAAQAEKALLDAQKAYESEARNWNIGSTEDASDLELTLEDYVTAEEDYREARDKLQALLDKDETNRERSDAQDDYDREMKTLAETYADLQKTAAGNGQPVEEKQAKLMSVIAALEVAREAQARLDDANLNPDDLASAEARLEAAVAWADAAEAALALYELRAPFGGTILSLGHLKSGEAVLPGVAVAYLGNSDVWTVETKDLAEVDISRVAIDQNAVVKLDAFPDETFNARVTAIDPVGREYLGDMTYKVTLTLDKTDVRFLWNMTSTVTIE